MTAAATTRARTTAAPSRARPGLYQRLVLDSLAAMTSGCMHLELPDGDAITVGTPGAHVTARIRVHDAAFFRKCVLFGDVGFGESYVDGDWDTDSIANVIAWAILNAENAPSLVGTKAREGALNLLKSYNRLQHLLRPNTLSTSRQNIAEHYDLGNEFYALWLDRTMTYSCACFSERGESLESAQIAKYDALCRKLRLQPTDRVLEIGSGWGGFASYAASHYGCHVTTVTISEAQFAYAKERFVRDGIADRVDIRLCDYRHITGRYDKVVSIEMMEALGDRYLETYFTKIHEVLEPGGLVGLQYITVPDARHDGLKRGVDWIQKHVFPGSLLLSVGRVNEALNRTGDLHLYHLEDLGADYATTLQRWWANFNTRHADVRALGYGERFIRKWNYYLQYCEAAFASRNISVVQAIYTRSNNPALGRQW